MPCTLADIAEWVAGSVQGNPQLEITGASPLGVARAGDITLIDNAEKARKANVGGAVAAIVPRGVSLPTLSTIEVENVHTAFAKIVAHFQPQRAMARIGRSPHAMISATAQLATDVEVHAGATIGDDVTIASGSVVHAGVHVMAGCRIGEQVTIFPNVVLYENTEVGARSIIHAGAIVGAYGFGYKCIDGRHQRGAQLGNVQIGEDVEIGANTTIDRGTYGPTVVGEGTKIDNQVMIAHNCRIGRHNMICSQVGIAGSSSTGDYVVIAGQAGVRDHVHIGDRAVLCAMAGIVNDVPPATTMLGAPATPERDQKLSMIAYMKLPEMRRQLRALELAVEQLKQQMTQENKTAA